ncbi:MAG: DUF4394 domain-containing protein [Actinomycetota bacterium]|nr:DUF4394 domain-containing protein [Actinomycetota bacterium]
MRKSLNARLVTFVAGAVLVLPTSVACGQDTPADEPPRQPAGQPPVAPPVTPPGQPAEQQSLNIVGLTDDNKLIQFSSQNPSPRDTGTISGLGGGDTRLVGIDYRAQDGKLYGVGDRGGVYSLEPTGQATSVGRLTIALQGTSFAVDFNPAANALRVVSDTGQNLRQPFTATPLPATIADTPLSAPQATPPANPANGVTAAAYTNNDTDQNTGTALFGLDTTADQIVLQSPANSGQLAPTGKLTVDATGDAGLDIGPVRGSPTGEQVAFATLRVGDQYGLYRVNLFTGKAETAGALGRNVIDLAIPLS